MLNKYIIDTGYSTTTECCPMCGDEIEIPINKLIDCTKCGHKEILPCSICKLILNEDNIACDWNEKTRCTPFPIATEQKK